MKTRIRRAIEKNPRLFGVLAVLFAGASYGTGPWFSQNLKSSGANPLGFLTARFVMSAAVLIAVRLIHLRGVSWPNFSITAKTFLLGAFGFFFSPLLYFIALDDLDSGLVVVIFYIYPAIAVVVSWIAYNHKPTLIITGCLISTLFGVWLTAGQIEGGKTISIVFVVLAAIIHALYVVAVGTMAKKSDPLTMLTITISGGATTFIIVSLFGSGSLSPKFPLTTTGWLLIMAMALLITIVATAAFYAGIKRIGPGVTSMVETFEVVVTMFIGIIILNESATPIQLVGTVVVLGSLIVLGLTESKQESLSDIQSGTILDLPIS